MKDFSSSLDPSFKWGDISEILVLQARDERDFVSGVKEMPVVDVEIGE